MKKLFSFIAVVLLVVVMAIPAFAGTVTPTYGGSGMGELKTVTLVNDSGTRAETTLSSTYIIPGKVKILGYTACTTGTGTSTENLVALADLGATGDTASYIVSENESRNAEGLQVLFPGNGLNISLGLHVGQGSRTCVTIYYIQVSA